ncbi:heavy metal translocating P-type ATPase [Baaleninema simplex]|uniref:heavy metal translocating P-type ATPase n=1 Tax=Baaleninema simplex TaxID=2862350 RepID=UPI00034A3C61|nr:heavy metal translocating P-type ATPase [Baaleninema simplex]
MVVALKLHSTARQKTVKPSQRFTVVQPIHNDRELSPPIARRSTHSNVNNRAFVPYAIVHSTPGRLRLRVPRLACDSHYLHRLQVLLEADECVARVRIKAAAMSVSVNYHTDRVSDDRMRFYTIGLIQLAATAITPAPSPNAESASESGWSQLKLPAFATLLALLAGPVGWSVPTAAIIGTIAAGSLPIAKNALSSIWQDKRLNIDCLDLMALVLTTLQGNPLTPSTILLLHKLGDLIRDRTARTSTRQALELIDSLDRFVWVERDGSKDQIPLDRVNPGDTVIVYPGEQIPVDGKILRGRASIDQQKLTGESMPVMREVGQTVYASTLVREGQLYILTEQTGADTRAGQSVKLVQNAPVGDTRMEDHAARLAEKAILPALCVSTGVLLVTGSMARAAAILTLDFMTGIRVSVPTTVLASMTAAARRGILIRSGHSLEQLARVDAVVFDKTGTLTQGDAIVTGVRTVNGADPQRLLELAATAEKRLTHPVASAVVRYARSQDVADLERGEWEYQVGLGVRADIDGEDVRVGSDRFLRGEGISLESLEREHPDIQGTSSIYVASNGRLLGAIQYTDPLRPETQATIEALQARGVEIHILTGDRRHRALTVAKELGIDPDKVHADAFPEQKATVVRQLHEDGKTVAFVGDGINDSAALAYADVSVSFGDGSEVARETADVVLMENDLESLVKAIALAKQTQQLIGENTRLSVIPNVAALSFATTVGLHPLLAAVVHNGSAIAAGVNGLRPLMSKAE